FTACVGAAVVPCTTAAAVAPWCILGAIFLCGLAVCAMECVRAKCWESTPAAEKTLTSGQQASESVSGTKGATEALGQIQKGMQLIMGSISISTQYKYSSGELYRATISAQTLYDRVSDLFQNANDKVL
ncbi:hypothetical protein BGZ46_003599, partial [Entomortierella lignicola]